MIKKPASQNKRILKSLKEIGLSAQAHGIPRIFGNERPFFKLLWILSFLASTSVFLYLFSKSIISYYDYLVVSRTEVINEVAIDFPTITICSSKPIQDYSINDVIIYCKFNYFTDCAKEPYFRKVYNKTYDLKVCFEFNKGDENTSILKVYKSSMTNGLTITIFGGLFNETLKDHFGLVHSTGLQVFIHNSSHLIRSENGMNIHPGEATFISLKKVVENKLGEPYNDCIKDVKSYRSFDSTIYEEISSKYIYTQKSCLDYVFLRFMNCSSHYESTYENCELNEQKINEIARSYISFYENKAFLKYTNLCPLECDYAHFETTLSHSYYPSYNEYQSLMANASNLISKFPKRENTTIDEIRQMIYHLQIYFEDSKYLLVSENPKQDAWDLISSVGGLLGLFLGLSFLSFIDLVQVIFEFIFILTEAKKTDIVELF